MTRSSCFRSFCFFVFIGVQIGSYSQTSSFLDSLLKTELPKYRSILNDPAKYKLQIIYTQINRSQNNEAELIDQRFHLTKDYVYPASIVKLPIALLALLKINELNKTGLSRSTTMLTDSLFNCHKKIDIDTSSATGFPSIENYIKRMFLVSDNDAFARTYEFVGVDYAHQRLKALGFEDIRLLNRLDATCAMDSNKTTPPIYFLDAKKDTVYMQSLARCSGKLIHPNTNSKFGKYHREKGKWVAGPKDFSQHNFLQISDAHELMKCLVFNDVKTSADKLPLDNNSRLFMIKELGLYPRESDFPRYDAKRYYDSFKKYFIYGSVVSKIEQDSVRVINIVGRAFGFLIDCAYIVDFKNNLEFFLTASIYVNESGRVGSGKYEYDQLGLPFLKDLSLCLYKYERQRKRTVVPDLTELKDLFEYK